MPAPRKYTDDQRAEALRLYETHGPTAAGKQLGIPKETIMRWVKASGTHTVRNEVTRAAVEAKVMDGKLRRQNIIHRLYGQAEKMLDDLEAPEFRTLVKAAGGADVEDTLSFVPPNDRRTLVQAINTATNNATNLEKVDANQAAESGVNMLTALADAFGIKDA